MGQEISDTISFNEEKRIYKRITKYDSSVEKQI